ncbi:hypothetical protein CLI64_04540 [Nostoc sp. CENA543]|uniref:DUF7003 family protein n=1 Tax=Nostoc sp. CENA543 TaxID=1869241 RepID=UPI000CA3D899|nr:hypothetical protein [Nostoc sp. CENA543]AUS99717.1 hypothetical protein CLI64_04540 [Nostoc sp. CENA543]
MVAYTVHEILECLDQAHRNLDFPGFGKINIDMVSARLTGFRNDYYWVLVFEELVHWYGLAGIQPVLAITAFSNRPDIGNGLFATLYPVEIENEDDYENTNALHLKIRGESLTVEPKSIPKHHYCNFGFNLLVYLLSDYRSQMLATEQELLSIVSHELIQVIQLDNWHHPNVYGWNFAANRHFLPSDAQSMQMIAKVLVTGNPNFYQPCEESNVDWRRWLKS